MQTKSQRKNAWRSRRREALRHEEATWPLASTRQPRKQDADSREKAHTSDKQAQVLWALAVIKYYYNLWDFAKSTPLMTKHKYNRLNHLMLFGNYRGIFENWIKAGGYISYYIQGLHKEHLTAYGINKSTNTVAYDFFDPTYGSPGRYVLTNSGSFYHLRNHMHKGTSDEFSIEQEKKYSLIQFRIIYGPPPLRP